MPIISEVGKKSFKVRTFIWSIYLVLCLGAVSMIYPFWLMVSGFSKSGVDSPESEIVPAFLLDKTVFYRKTVEAFFNEKQDLMQMIYGVNNKTFRTIEAPCRINNRLIAEWKEFQDKSKLPFYFYEIAFTACVTSRSTQPEKLREFKALLKNEFGNSCEVMNLKLNCSFFSWENVVIKPVNYTYRRERPGSSAYILKYRHFKEKQKKQYRYYFCPEGLFKQVYLKAQYTKNIDEYNKINKTNYESWKQIYFPRRYPQSSEYTIRQQHDWNIFVRTILNLFWIRADKKAEPTYQNYLKAKYNKNIASFNKLYSTKYKSFAEIPLIDVPPVSGICLSDWDSFIQGWIDPDTGKKYILPNEMIYINSIEFMFRDFLLAKYKSLEQINIKLGTEYSSMLEIYPPQKEANYRFFMKNTGHLKWEFIKRNFISVFEYIVLQGRGLFNTVVYCFLAILGTLLVNPLAAYALSRYKMPSTYKILLFLMLTMAFPPMVTNIPTFLMLREFNLLNTFWALILPGLANGYSIFLLKGFFDSLPQELYESASLDGAGEFRIFWQITMSLSKPILAVISLQAFNIAYSNFMMALLYCQDQKMWTLMPWLYQLQQRSGQGVIFASLIIAAIPTFIVFVFCQNIIMRGIVVPVEK